MTKSFEELLDDQHSFPGPYTFKFIVPAAAKELAIALVAGAKVSLRASKNGKYVSVTLVAEMACADDVVKVYEKAKTVPGIFSL